MIRMAFDADDLPADNVETELIGHDHLIALALERASEQFFVGMGP